MSETFEQTPLFKPRWLFIFLIIASKACFSFFRSSSHNDPLQVCCHRPEINRYPFCRTRGFYRSLRYESSSRVNNGLLRVSWSFTHTGFFVSFVDRKGNRIEIYTITPDGLKPTLESSIYGTIIALHLYHPHVSIPTLNGSPDSDWLRVLPIGPITSVALSPDLTTQVLCAGHAQSTNDHTIQRPYPISQ